jgi:hypothetical protein
MKEEGSRGSRSSRRGREGERRVTSTDESVLGLETHGRNIKC